MSRIDNASIRELNERLTKQPYVSGFTPSSDDEKYFTAIFGDNVNVVQWAARMASYYQVERKAMKPKTKDPHGSYVYHSDDDN